MTSSNNFAVYSAISLTRLSRFGLRIAKRLETVAFHNGICNAPRHLDTFVPEEFLRGRYRLLIYQHHVAVRL